MTKRLNVSETLRPLPHMLHPCRRRVGGQAGIEKDTRKLQHASLKNFTESRKYCFSYYTPRGFTNYYFKDSGLLKSRMSTYFTLGIS